MLEYTVSGIVVDVTDNQVNNTFFFFLQVRRGRSVGGTCLGLVICEPLCKLMGGSTSCSSLSRLTVSDSLFTTNRAEILTGEERRVDLTRASTVSVLTDPPQRGEKKVSVSIEDLESNTGDKVRPIALITDSSPVNVNARDVVRRKSL